MFRNQLVKVWNFPSRLAKVTPETEQQVVERIRTAWEANANVKTIQQLLEDDGFEMTHAQFQRIRTKHGLRRRETGGYKVDQATANATKRKRATDDVPQDQTAGAEALDDDTGEEGGMEGAAAQALSAFQQAPTINLTAEEQQRRNDRLLMLQQASDEAFNSRKRHRRIRGWGPLGPDAPGLPPRHMSETTIDECKAFLALDNDTYIALRADFAVICGEYNIERKKTALDDGRWQMAKDRIIRNTPHLSSVMHPLQPQQVEKANALDVLCMDITKRLRDGVKAITIARANNILGLNPTESKGLRREFYQILDANNFSTRLQEGGVRLEEMKQKWYAQSAFLTALLAEGDALKLRCIEKLSRDAGKRYNDDKAKAGSVRPPAAPWTGPGPGPAHPKGKGVKDGLSEGLRHNYNIGAGKAAMVPIGPPRKHYTFAKQNSTTAGTTPQTNQPLDPLLNPPFSLAPTIPPLPPSPAIPAYFRLSPDSQLIGHHPRLWLGKLALQTIQALHAAATGKAGAATVARVQGVVGNAEGGEDLYRIDGKDELVVYLEVAGEKAMFIVTLVGGYA